MIDFTPKKRKIVVVLCAVSVVSIAVTLLQFQNHFTIDVETARSNGFRATNSSITRAFPVIEKIQIYTLPSQPLFDLENVIGSRIGDTVMNDTNENPFTDCSPTAQYQVKIINRTTSLSSTTKWIIQSLMLEENGENAYIVPKTYGGDEVYVEWKSNTDFAVAKVVDLKDGTYELAFFRPPVSQYNRNKNINDFQGKREEMFGQLTIFYEYTCGIGNLYYPMKELYLDPGGAQQTLTIYDIPKPEIHEFIPPNLDGTINLAKYGAVLGFGDSVMRELFTQTVTADPCPGGTSFVGVPHELSNESHVDWWLNRFDEYNGKWITDRLEQNHTVALVTGAGIWDLLLGHLYRNMTSHLNAVQKFIFSIQTKYPTVDIYWKATSPTFLHRRGPYHISQYNGVSVPRALNVAQKKLMKELDIPYMDLFDSYFLSANWTHQGDTIHWGHDSPLPSLLFSYFWPGLDKVLQEFNDTIFYKF